MPSGKNSLRYERGLAADARLKGRTLTLTDATRKRCGKKTKRTTAHIYQEA